MSGRGNDTHRKLTPLLLCPPQIPHDLAGDRTRTATAANWLSYGRAMHATLEVIVSLSLLQLEAHMHVTLNTVTAVRALCLDCE
jgi:hypothetical protein